MPELLLPIFIFYLIYLYFSIKKSKSTTEKLAIKTPVEQPLVIGAAKAKAQKGSTPQISRKPKAGILKTKSSQTGAVALTEKNIKKTTPVSKSPKNLQAIATAKATLENPDTPMSERVGLTAGSLWHYLDKNGTSPIAKVVREMTEEEKIVQRSIGWLAQEGKVKIDTVDRVEIIALIK